MKTRTLLALCCLSAGALAVGCQESTAPRGGYFATRSDPGVNIDSDSPSVPERSGPGMGMGTGTDAAAAASGSVPASARDSAPPATQPSMP